MSKSFFSISHRSKKACLPAGRSKARVGTITTAHGTVQTPAFVPVGTKGTIKALPPAFFKDIGIKLSFVNTYHLVTHPGVEVIQKAGGIHKYAKYNIPLMSDSGGFQVFSLAGKNKSQITNNKLQTNFKSQISSNSRKANVRGDEEPLVLKINEDGVTFRSVYDGQTIEFTPETSMEFQKTIGADMIMAFDECTYYPAPHEYAQKAMKRTHEWLKRCIAATRIWRVESGRLNFEDRKLKIEKQKTNSTLKPLISKFHLPSSIIYPQYLYGIIQGGTYEDLRVASAKFIDEQDVAGVAIGGVSVGESKEEMRDQIKWVAPYLPADKPVHLLGVGHIDDIIDLVKYGIDTFDCVEPTRLARMGVIYNSKQILLRLSSPPPQTTCLEYELDITKSIYKADLSPVDEECDCYVCQNYSKSYLYHLFKQKEILGYTLATYHNLAVMEKLMGEIRNMIREDMI